MSTNEIIKSLCKEHGISISSLEEKLGFSNGSIGKARIMASDRLLAVARYFNVSMEYLMDAEFPDSGIHLSPEELRLISDYRNLNTTGKDYILQTMTMISTSYAVSDSIDKKA